MADMLNLFLNQKVSYKIVSWVNIMLKAKRNWDTMKPSPDEVVSEYVEKEKALAEFVAIDKENRFSAPVWGALMDRYHTSQDPRVLEFGKQVEHGEMLQKGDPAFTLRKVLSENTKALGGSAAQKERYLKTQVALTAFLEDRKLFIIRIK
jgi:hypothetical protein